MILDGSQIADFQSCQRKWAISQGWWTGRWNPKVLFDACYRRAILGISQGKSIFSEAAIARARLLESAANPGMDTTGDPYQSAMEWATLLQNAIIGSEGRVVMGMREIERLEEWRFLAWKGPDKRLHRIVSASHISNNLVEHMRNSWQTVGDMAMARMPMTIHVLLIGESRHGVRHSMWTRAWRDPGVVNGHYHFRNRSGNVPKNWKAFWMTERPGIDPLDWVGRMKYEGVLGGMFCEIEVPEPGKRESGQIAWEIENIKGQMFEIGGRPIAFVPMSRNSCDDVTPCWAKKYCYSGEELDLKDCFVPIGRLQGICASTP